MKVGILATGDTAVRAAHSLAAHPGVDEVVVIGPASSRSFPVVADADGCDVLVGTGDEATKTAGRFGVPLVWDGEPDDAVAMGGAGPIGLALAIADRIHGIAAVAHPGLDPGTTRPVAFPAPVGRVRVDDRFYAGRAVAAGQSKSLLAACLADGDGRRLAIIDEGPFLSGIALAAAVLLDRDGARAVWEDSLRYLQAATEMGLVMAEG